MKNFLAYYSASKKNKIRVYLIAFIVYMLLYLMANPHTYDIHWFNAKMTVRSTIKTVSQVFSGTNNSSVQK